MGVARTVYDTVDEDVVTMVPEQYMERVQQQVQRMVPQTVTEQVATQVPRTVMQEVQTVQQPVQQVQVVQQPVQTVQVQQPVQTYTAPTTSAPRSMVGGYPGTYPYYG